MKCTSLLCRISASVAIAGALAIAPTLRAQQAIQVFFSAVDGDGKPAVSEKRSGIPREGSKPEEFGGLAKINMETGEVQHIYKGRAPGNGAVLTTAGDLVFWGDLDGKFRAFDAATGKTLWETTLGGPIDNSTISYAVNGKQYIAVMSGEGLLTGGLITQAGISPARRHNEMYVFALPDQR